MAVQMKVPAVGESISEVTIGKWNKKEGDTVAADELLCELESDKATFELRSETAGVLHIKAQEGEVLPIGGLLCEIEAGAGAAKPATAPAAKADASAAPETEAKPAAAPAAASSAPAKTVEMKVPAVGESITEVTISNWTKKSGDAVAFEDLLCELESDKATFELRAEAAGVLEIVAQAGATVPIGALLCKIQVGAGAPVAAAKAEAPAAAAATSTPASNGGASYAAGHASPAAAKALAEKGVNPADVKGTGPGGRITKEDAMSANKPAATAPASNGAGSAATPVAFGPRGQRREKMTNLRKTISRRLVAVKNETAMLTTFNEVNMKPVMDLRSKYKDAFKEKHGVGLGFMSFFTKAVTQALKEFPSVNAYIEGDEILFNDFCDVSIAVSAPRGLVVPVIRNAETMSFNQIEAEIIRLATKARDNKLTVEEMTGGTFTITNGGIFGSMMSTPIINAPQSAILGMHNIVERPMAVNGQVVILPMMYLALSYDHRIIDGRESVGFLVRVKQLLEDPARLMLGV